MKTWIKWETSHCASLTADKKQKEKDKSMNLMNLNSPIVYVCGLVRACFIKYDHLGKKKLRNKRELLHVLLNTRCLTEHSTRKRSSVSLTSASSSITFLIKICNLNNWPGGLWIFLHISLTCQTTAWPEVTGCWHSYTNSLIHCIKSCAVSVIWLSWLNSVCPAKAGDIFCPFISKYRIPDLW